MNLKKILLIIAKYAAYLFLVIVISFVLPRLIPGSPLNVLAGEGSGYTETVPAALLEAFEQYFSPNEPMHVQFFRYLRNLAHFDLGISLSHRTPVAERIAVSIRWTLQLTIPTIVISTVLGLLLGVSLGVMLREGATTGGTELAAKLLKYRFRNLSVGRLCLIIDVLVIGLYALTFRNVNNALYGIISMYVCSLVMDMVVYGSITAKLAYIISDENDRIREKLMEMGLGGTIVQGKGAYTGERKDVLLCAAKPSNLAAIKSVVASVDKENAFVIVCDAREVFGEGFGTHSEDPV